MVHEGYVEGLYGAPDGPCHPDVIGSRPGASGGVVVDDDQAARLLLKCFPNQHLGVYRSAADSPGAQGLFAYDIIGAVQVQHPALFMVQPFEVRHHDPVHCLRGSDRSLVRGPAVRAETPSKLNCRGNGQCLSDPYAGDVAKGFKGDRGQC